MKLYHERALTQSRNKVKIEDALEILRPARKRSELTFADVGITASGTEQVPGV